MTRRKTQTHLTDVALGHAYQKASKRERREYNSNDWAEILLVMREIERGKKVRAIAMMEEQDWLWPGGIKVAYTELQAAIERE